MIFNNVAIHHHVQVLQTMDVVLWRFLIDGSQFCPGGVNRAGFSAGANFRISVLTVSLSPCTDPHALKASTV